MTIKRLVISTIAIICLFVGSLDVWASNIGAQIQRRDEITASINASRAQLVDTRGQIRMENAQLQAIELEMADAVETWEELRHDLDIMEALLADAEIELDQAKEVRDRQFDAFVSRARYIYMTGWTGYIDAILGADNFTDLLNRIDHVNRIIEFDRNLVNELQRAEDNIARIVKNTQRQRDELAILEAVQAMQVRRHDEALSQKEAIIALLELDEAAIQREIDAEQADLNAIQRIIDAHEEEQRRLRAQEAARAAAANRAPANQPTQIAPDGNALQWPVQGRGVNSGYGNRRDPFTGRTNFHTGVDIPAPLGTNIFAAESGRVIFSGWQGGYGNTVIIDHSTAGRQGMTTLYGHASSLLVRQGDTVRRGQVIARVGSTGRSTGNHLHFEVRINGQHTNPMNFTRVN